MKIIAVSWLALLMILLWVMNPTITYAYQGNLYNAAPDTGLQANLMAKGHFAPSYQLTPTPLPAIYKVEQTHPAMITGAAILVLIIVVGVLAFSRRRA